MTKIKKQKYYAIKKARSMSDTILTIPWEQVKPLVQGCNSVYKSFNTKEEAEHYLKTIDTEKAIKQVVKGKEQTRKKKATTRAIQTRIPKDIYAEFLCKCEEMEFSTDTVILKLIKEWVEE